MQMTSSPPLPRKLKALPDSGYQVWREKVWEHFLAAYCVLRTENIFVCWCCVGSDRVAGVGVSLGTLDLVRVDGRPCLGWYRWHAVVRSRHWHGDT